MIKYFLPFLLMTTFTGTLLAQEKLGPEKELTAEDLEESIKTLDEPMYTPFVELYLLEESKALRKEMQNTRAELIEKVVDKELSVADKTHVLCHRHRHLFFLPDRWRHLYSRCYRLELHPGYAQSADQPGRKTGQRAGDRV